MIAQLLAKLDQILLWGCVATAAMTTLMEGAQQFRLSRMSLPFLFGTIFSDNRREALVYGFVAYATGGLLFSFLYAAMFESIGRADWWIGAIIGLAHTAFLLVVFLPLLARLHPRMANEYDGPSAIRRIEPPGPLGLHYGRPTPLVTLVGQSVFGLILGTFYPMPL